MTTAIEVLESLSAAAQILALLPLSPLWRTHYNREGSTPTELNHAYPCDERVPVPLQSYTRTITIHAPPAFIWAYLLQLGQERGGMYSYDCLENLVGCQMHSVEQVRPEWQTIEIGQPLRFGPKGKGFPLQKVVAYEWERYIVLAGADPQTEVVNDPTLPTTIVIANVTWGLYLERQNEQTTRLISRSRLSYPPRRALKLMWRITEVLNLVMERKMLQTIKRLAERDFRQPA